MSALDRQVGGGHYRELTIQPVQFAMNNRLGFCEGSAVKYLTRWRDKGGVEDLRKALHFIQFIREDRSYQLDLLAERRENPVAVDHITSRQYCEANGIPQPEFEIIQRITGWNIHPDIYQLDKAAEELADLIGAAWVSD